MQEKTHLYIDKNTPNVEKNTPNVDKKHPKKHPQRRGPERRAHEPTPAERWNNTMKNTAPGGGPGGARDATATPPAEAQGQSPEHYSPP